MIYALRGSCGWSCSSSAAVSGPSGARSGSSGAIPGSDMGSGSVIGACSWGAASGSTTGGGAEVIGEVPPALEAEVIAMLFSFLRELGLNDLRLAINRIRICAYLSF